MIAARVAYQAQKSSKRKEVKNKSKLVQALIKEAESVQHLFDVDDKFTLVRPTENAGTGDVQQGKAAAAAAAAEDHARIMQEPLRAFPRSTALPDVKIWYQRLAKCLHWVTYEDQRMELFVLLNIIIVGVTTGIDLDYMRADGSNREPRDLELVIDVWIPMITLAVFTVEIIIKIVAEGLQPQMYILGSEGGPNAFDFLVVLLSYVFIKEQAGSSVAVIRLLRLFRLLHTFKFVETLRVILEGLISGMYSVVYIVMLLVLIM